MKIFISWSGKHSHGVALALNDWLPDMFTGIQIFVSSESIRKGKRWAFEIAKELDTTNFGIACLTTDNLKAEWLLFETGALSKSVKESCLSTLLLGKLRPSDVTGPLSHFQHTQFEKEDVFKLVKSINEELTGDGKRDETRLKKVFEKFWDELETRVNGVMKTSFAVEKKRDTDDMLRELLETTNYISRNMRPTKDDDIFKEQLLRAVPISGEQSDGLWKVILSEIRENLSDEVFELLDTAHARIAGDRLFLFFEEKRDKEVNRLITPPVRAEIQKGLHVFVKRANLSIFMQGEPVKG